MQLAANWPDKQTSKSSVILSDQAGSPEAWVTDCKQSNRAAVETKRENSPIGKKKRSDSPNPEKILLAIQCFKKGLTWKEIVISTDVPERTLRRYLKELGYQRDYKFVSEKLNNFLWVTFTRSNPSHDIAGLNSFVENKHWGCKGPLFIDARIKPHHAPPLEKDAETERKIDRLFLKGGSLAGVI